MATVPQIQMRNIDLSMGEPPTLAASAPDTARKIMAAAYWKRTIVFSGANSATSKGNAPRVQLDFKDADANGNFRQKHYHENYGYDLEAVVSRHPIKELDNPSHKDDLLNSLKKGNRQSATFIKDGQEVKQYIEATPQFKTLTIYDADQRRLDTRQAKEQQQSQSSETSKKQDIKAKQSNGEEDSPGEQQEKKQRRKAQKL